MSTRQPKLVRVITRMNIGGPSRHVSILTTGCRPEFDTFLLAGDTEGREGSLAEEAGEHGVEVVRVPHLRRSIAPIADFLALVWLVRYFRKERPDIVATHMAKAGTLGRLAATLAGVPVIVHTFHGHVLDGYFRRLPTSLFLITERLLSRVTTQFIAISPEVASDLERLGIGRGKTTVVRLGLRLDHLGDGTPGQVRGPLQIPAGSPLVGIVGRLVPIKALDIFLQAAAALRESHPDIHFVVVGDGQLWEELHRLTHAMGLEERVHFTGWRSDLPDVYRDLDIVVCCSKNEGTPVSLIEACAASKPVIGTRVGGIPDIITAGVNGLMVPSGDANALAGAIRELVDDPERRRNMGSAGHKIVMEQHSADRMVRELKAVYERLMRRAHVRAEAA